jgi:Protein of unknown function (DUF2568)
VRAANLALRFVLELAALAGLAEGGDAVAGWPAAAVAVVAGAVAWGLWCAPRARRRLAQPARTGVEAAVFGLGAAGYAAGGSTLIAIVFVVLALANWALLFAFGDDP